MIFFYELLFALVALGAVLIGEVWSRLAAFLFLPHVPPFTALSVRAQHPLPECAQEARSSL